MELIAKENMDTRHRQKEVEAALAFALAERSLSEQRWKEVTKAF
jgi:hypothetical protein